MGYLSSSSGETWRPRPSEGVVSDQSVSAYRPTFLDHLYAADRSALLDALRPRGVAGGETLFHEGAGGVAFAVVLTGRFKVVARSANGRKVLIGLVGPGDLVGEMAILSDAPRSADVVAIEAARVAVGSAETFRRQVLAHRPVLLALSHSLAERLRETDVKRVDAAALDASVRLAAELLELGRRYGHRGADGLHIDLPITQEELADLLGLSRPTVARALAQLRADGQVVTGRRRLTIIDPAKLRAAAGG